MRYLDFLQRFHEVLEPSAYLEIGVRQGNSLALARCPSIGIDPDYELEREVSPKATLFGETSDRYFERSDPLAPLDGEAPSLAFIDGMHLAEFALRDFVNVERCSDWTSVVVFDDVFPRKPGAATRTRESKAWTGDVHKLVDILDRHRPDLITLPVDTTPAGILLVLGLDSSNRVLADRYEQIEREIRDRGDAVPDEILERRGVLDARQVLASPAWPFLRDARRRGLSRERGLPGLRAIVSADRGLAAAA